MSDFRVGLVDFTEIHWQDMILDSGDDSLRHYNCHVPIFGLPCYTVGDDFWGLCQPGQRGEVMLPVSSEGLEELYGAQPIPFIIFHHRDHFCTVRSWFVAFRRFS
jgi:hypothetical protein